MSFAQDTKAELCRLNDLEDCCKRSLLSALLHVGGSLKLTHSGIGFTVNTENPAVARLTFKLLRACCNVRGQIRTYRMQRLNKTHSYEIYLRGGEEAKRVLLYTGILQTDAQAHLTLRYVVPDFVFAKECCLRSYIRGAFLMGGTLSDPEKSYHLEISTADEEYADSLKKALSLLSLPSGLTRRKGRTLLYIKDSDSIVDFLLMIGATGAMLQTENVRINKSVRNSVNRTMNCESYNINKTMDAAQRQRDAIRLIEKTGNYAKLSRVLRETADLRMEYPEASLDQLAEAHVPPVTKSAVNHRLRKITEMADRLRGE